MPANLTPDYKAAEKAFRRAREPREKLDCLKDMLRLIPKHKGTEHLQADIKSRIKELTEELTGPKKTGARGGPPTVIRPEGAGQVALVGPPNSGKSTLHALMTGSHAQVGDYPFTTQYPQPGMIPVDDIHIQLVDLPPIAIEHPVPWIANALQVTDGVALVVDLSEPGCVERVVALHEILAERKVRFDAPWPADAGPTGEDEELFAIRLPVVLVVSKADLLDDLDAELEAFRELAGVDYPALAVSAHTGAGVEELGRWLFDKLAVVRVYTKIPGQHADMDRPFTVRRGDTVHDVAELVHRDIAASLQYARVWGAETFDGQQVGPEHEVADGDVLELHA